MARYRAKAPLQFGARRIAAGETFSSDATPGRNWQPLDDEATERVIARFGKVLPDRPQNFGFGGRDSLWRTPRL